jgi:glycosyltransferase involved in cell wall biosynthesis
LTYSIIIPVLNEEKLLPQLLDQLTDPVLMDKFGYEIIVSDGRSTDGTINILQKYPDVSVVMPENEKQNIAGGRNTGARNASGEIFIFINADVLIKDLERFFLYLLRKFIPSGYSALTCKVKVFPREEIFSDIVFHWIYNNYFRLLNFIGLGMGRGECQVIRREAFLKAGGYNEKLAAGEDFDLFKRVKKFGKILFTNKICVYESPRRFRKVGYFKVTWSWIANAFAVIFKNKSISNEWEQIR